MAEAVEYVSDARLPRPGPGLTAHSQGEGGSAGNFGVEVTFGNPDGQ